MKRRAAQTFTLTDGGKADQKSRADQKKVRRHKDYKDNRKTVGGAEKLTVVL